MITKYTVFIICLIAGVFTFAQQNDSLTVKPEISGKAIWWPGMEMMHAIHDSCDSMKYPTFGDCFAAQMKQMGASEEALEFTKLTGNEGFMRDFKECGKVDVAYAVYPFRANENQLCFLVNGLPDIIDVDNYDIISKINLKKNKVYNQIFRQYPNVSIWPGDRSGDEYPVARNLPDGGQQFIFNYRLQVGCHACKLIGSTDLAFNFNSTGKFIAVKIVDVLKINQSGKNLMVQGEYSNAGKVIKIKSGQPFTIALQSNATTGYSWQFADSLNEEIVYNIGKIYLPPLNQMPGAGGKEEWKFISAKPGNAEIRFRYVRPWEKGVKPAKELTVKIIVE